jgi:hypothetical protein
MSQRKSNEMKSSRLTVSFLRTQTERNNKVRLFSHTHTQTHATVGAWEVSYQKKLFWVVFFSYSRSNETPEEEKSSLLSKPERNRGKIIRTVYFLTLLTLLALLCSALLFIHLSLALWPLFVKVDDDWNSVP